MSVSKTHGMKKSRDTLVSLLKQKSKDKIRQSLIRSLTFSWYESIKGSISKDQLFLIAIGLIRRSSIEEKLAGILLYEKELLAARSSLWRSDVELFSKLFDDGSICYWNCTDWFSIRILGNLIALHGLCCAKIISRWHTSPNIWKRRASVVAFVNVVKQDKKFKNLATENAVRLVRSKEPLHQTAVGWVMRELGTKTPKALDRFLKANLTHLSSECLSCATEKMNGKKRNAFKALHRNSRIPSLSQ